MSEIDPSYGVDLSSNKPVHVRLLKSGDIIRLNSGMYRLQYVNKVPRSDSDRTEYYVLSLDRNRPNGKNWCIAYPGDKIRRFKKPKI